jgi:hypothetical protein
MLPCVTDRADDITRELKAAFTSAFAPYVDRVAAERGWPLPPDWADAVAAGRTRLAAALDEVLGAPMGRQARSPLELFQDALRLPTEALAAAGVAPVERDPVEVNALPGDRYAMAPASSQALGERAWKAHVAWGMEKARLVAGVVPAAGDPGGVAPSVALVGVDLMDRVRIEEAATAAGYTLQLLRNPAAVEAALPGPAPAVVFVDMAHPAADDAMRAMAGAGWRMVAFGPHVDDAAMVRAMALGAAEVLPRSRFFRRLPDLLPRLA